MREKAAGMYGVDVFHPFNLANLDINVVRKLCKAIHDFGRSRFAAYKMVLMSKDVFLTHESLMAKLRAEIPADSLRWLQETAQPPYRNRLVIDGKLEDVLCVTWNAPTLRPKLRDILVIAAEGWLAEAEDEGVEPSPSPELDAAHEVERCVAEGLLVPPGPCVSSEEMAAFVKVAAMPVKPESTSASGGSNEEQLEL